jgi:tryptophan synthase alpha chain
VEAACRASSGFVYCVALTGVTGSREELAPELAEVLVRARRHTELPLAAGFGLSRPEHMRALRGLADAAVVASALMEEVHQGRDPLVRVQELLRACR